MATKRKKSKFRKCYPYDIEDAPFIEEGIRPLVAALDQWDDLKIMFSCEGHPEHPKFNLPYVTFKASDVSGEKTIKKIINELKQRIKNTGWGIFHKDNFGFYESNPVSQKNIRLDYTIRPYKRRKLKTSINDMAKLICCKNTQHTGIVYYHE